MLLPYEEARKCLKTYVARPHLIASAVSSASIFNQTPSQRAVEAGVDSRIIDGVEATEFVCGKAE